MAEPQIHVGVDATTWSNDRGFGRFTREFVSALAERARQPGSRFRCRSAHQRVAVRQSAAQQGTAADCGRTLG